MTEGTPADLATWQDVQGRWRPLNTAEQATATLRIGDASSLLRTLVPDLVDRIAADTTGDLARVALSKVADVVSRLMRNPTGAKNLQETIGNRSYGLTLPDGQPTGIFFTEDELDALRPSAATGQGHAIGTTFVSIRPGWGPRSDSPAIGWWPTS